ncbi:LOW QUALITY PROTEIN: spermatogenesis associated 6-like protein [Amazona ochrocephala]
MAELRSLVLVYGVFFFQNVTCPVMFLPEKHDIFLSVCISGQHTETESLPPVFPIANNIHCSPYTFNTQDFLSPERKLTPAYPDVHRLVMKTSHFSVSCLKLVLSIRV